MTDPFVMLPQNSPESRALASATSRFNSLSGQIADLQNESNRVSRFLIENEDYLENVNPNDAAVRAEVATLTQRQNELDARIGELSVQQREASTQLADARASYDTALDQYRSDLKTKDSAAGQTADQQVENTTPDTTPGAGTNADTQQDPQPLTDEQVANVENSNNGSVEVQTNPDDLANNTTPEQEPRSEEKISDPVLEPVAVVAGSVQSNILHQYTSYTYRLTLFLLSKDDFNQLSEDAYNFEPKYSLMSSGGGYASKTAQSVSVSVPGSNQKGEATDTRRHPDFRDNFFIDNLQLTTVVGLNARSKASNAVEIGFTITEPYGMTLLDRLLSACQTLPDPCDNYIEQPYLLQIEFFASPTDPALESSSTTTTSLISRKRLAIKIREMKISPGVNGTVYQVMAIPFNHAAFSTTVASAPVPFSIEASTVEEFFSNSDDVNNIFRDQIAENNERIESQLARWKSDYEYNVGIPTEAEIANRRKTITDEIRYSSTSFTAAYNEYMKSIAKEQNLSLLPPLQIGFNIIDKEIANASIVNPANSQADDAALTRSDQSVNSVNAKFKKSEVFQINPGDSVIDIIDRVIKKSDYIKNQIQDSNKQSNDVQNQENTGGAGRESSGSENLQFKTIDWYKIIPTVALKDFDGSRNAYSKLITYNIIKYQTGNTYNPNFKKIKTADVYPVRTYQYLYTGQNTDIIDIRIDFDTAYYTQISTYKSQIKRSGSNNNSDEENVDLASYGTTAQNQTPDIPVPIELAGSSASAMGLNTARSPEDRVIDELSQSIYSSLRGDMLNIKMTIIGDPAFIKQDDVYYTPSDKSGWEKFSATGIAGAPISSTGQIVYDKEQIYIRLIFKNAVDIDSETGIVNKQVTLTNGRTTNSSFSGLYKVLTVKSDFSNGKFTQVLDIVRIPEPLTKATKSTDATVNTSQPSVTETNLTVDRVSTPVSINNIQDPIAVPVDNELIAAANQPAEFDPAIIAGTGARVENAQSALAGATNINETRLI